MATRSYSDAAPLPAAPEDYIASLASLVLLRAGCDHFPVVPLALLRRAAAIVRAGEEISVSPAAPEDPAAPPAADNLAAQPAPAYTVAIPENLPLDRAWCAEALLCLLLRALGRDFRDDRERRRFVMVFTCHLLCPRPALALMHRTWASAALLERFFGLPRRAVRMLCRCPACYVPEELNTALLSAFRARAGIPAPAPGEINEVALRVYMSGYADEDLRLAAAPALRLDRLRDAVDALIPAHALSLGHPASLMPPAGQDFAAFSRQFAALGPEALYRLAFPGEEPVPPLRGGDRPQPGDKDYAPRMREVLLRESAARLAAARLLYRPDAPAAEKSLLAETLRGLYDRKEEAP